MLRWSFCGVYLAAPCTSSVAIVDLSRSYLHDIGELGLTVSAGGSVGCAWVPGSDKLAVWQAEQASGSFTSFTLLSKPGWAASQLMHLEHSVHRPQWSYQRLAAIAEYSSLVLYSVGSSSAQLLATLPAALPVTCGADAWADLSTFAWRPSGRYLAVVFSSSEPASDLSLQLLDGHKGGSSVWSYQLRGTSKADIPGKAHVVWSADSSSLTVCITADFPRKWHKSFRPESSGCCIQRCPGCKRSCPQYMHAEEDPLSNVDFDALFKMLGNMDEAKFARLMNPQG